MPTYPIERHVRIKDVSSPVFGPDDERIYFLSDISGTRSLWEISEPRQWPRQRTFTDETVLWSSWSPAGDEVAFGMDQSGDERMQLYLLDDHDQTVTKLTDDPDAVHRWGGWSSDGSSFAYAANRRHPGLFDVYVQEREADYEDARRVYEHDRRSSIVPLGWGPDDERLVVTERHSSFNTDLHIIDVESNDRTLLTEGPDENVRYKSVSWGPDGESLYLITDRDYNWLYVARLDLDSLELQPVVQPEANVKRLIVHPDEERIAYAESRNGYTEITAGELSGRVSVDEFPEPDFPKGVIDSLSMSHDGTRLVVVYYEADSKPDVYTIDVETGETTQWTDISAPIPDDAYTEPTPIRYESYDGLEIPSLYAEPDDADEASQPAMIHLHGGPRSQNFPTIDPVRQYYLEQGFVRLEPNFRGSSGYGKEYMSLDDVEKRPDSIQDVETAADWLADQSAVDADRIVLDGISYGGFLVLSAMTRWPDKFAAGFAVSPIVDFETYLENTSEWRRELRAAEYGSLEEHRDLLRELSPIHDVGNLDSPLFIVHGENDSRIPIEQVREFAERARDQGVPVETAFIDDMGHRLDGVEHRVKICRQAAEFFDEHV